MRVYELEHVRPYVSADGCSLQASTRDHLQVSCPAPAKLIRLEAALPGWSAVVNGAEMTVASVESAFQVVDLPAGNARVDFIYSPKGLTPALAAAGVALSFILLVGGWSAWRRVVKVAPDPVVPATDRSSA